jgi:cell division protein FtsL
MMRSATLVWILLSVVVAGALFRVSYRVQHLEKHIASVNKQIGQQEEAIRVLQAEWSYLNEPSRLEALTRKHLTLLPTTTTQIVTIEQVPTRPVLAAASTDHQPAPAKNAAAPNNTVVLAAAKRGGIE